MKKAEVFAAVLLIAFVLSGCAPRSTDPSGTPGEEAPPVQTPDDVSAPGGPAEDTGPNAMESLRVFDLLGRPAGEVAQIQDSPVESWEYYGNMYGFDYFLDESNDVEYIFANYQLFRHGHENNDICEEDVCVEAVAHINNCFSLSSEAPADMIAELSGIFSAEFEWIAYEEEEDYEYAALVETRSFPVLVIIYTDKNKEFQSFYWIEFRMLSDYITAYDAMEDHWFYDLLCRSASEMNEIHYMPMDAWKRQAGMDGYDCYRNGMSDTEYLFAHKDGDLDGEDICEGIADSIEGLLFQNVGPDEVLSILSKAFSVEFEWTPYGEGYGYVALAETSLFPVRIVIYTDQNKEFDLSSIIQFTVPPEYVCRRPVQS